MSLFEEYYKNNLEFSNNNNLNLNRIDNALYDIGFSEKNLGKIVHIAGTNGKGSTSFFLAQMLEKNGYKTALFTSPHINTVRERISVSLKNINQDVFDNLFQRYTNTIKKYQLSYFEGIFFIAMVMFSIEKPDFTILETGLGGRLDATNTGLITNKTCIITSLSYDHSDILGKNIYKIIDEKLGILRQSSKVLVGPNKKFILDYISTKHPKAVTNIVVSPFASNSYPYPFSENYCLAKKAAEYLLNSSIADCDNLALPSCRLERINNIILDGSHNPAGLLALMKSQQINKNSTVIFTSTNDRDLFKTFSILSKISNNIILTTLPDNHRSITEHDVEDIDCLFISSPKKALDKALEICGDNDILVTGSFYLCSVVKKIISEAKD